MTQTVREEDVLTRDDRRRTGGEPLTPDPAAGRGVVVVGYVVSRFPHFSETFIVREMSAVEETGVTIVPFALVRQRQEARSQDAVRWLARMRWTGLSVGLLGANARALRRQPRVYAALWRDALRGNLSSVPFLVRAVVVLPKAVLVAEVLTRERATHVHAHYATHPALAAWVVHRLTGLPYSVTVHAHDLFTSSPMLEQKLSAAAFVATVSAYNRTWITERVGAHVGVRTRVVRCGVDPARYDVARQPRAAGAPLRLLCTGSLQEYKGHRHLIEACALLRSAGLDLRCLLVGDGRLRSQLERLVRGHGLQDVVQFVGVQDEQRVAGLLATTDCYVQPSVVAADGQMEGVPVALMEAMAAGVPVVATRLSGVPELVVDGSTGLLVPPADAGALAAAVLAVAADPEAAQRRADAGRQHVLHQYDARKNARELASLLASADGRRPEEMSA